MAAPQGEIREALFQSFCVLCAERGPVSILEAAHHAQVGFDAAQTTVENMVRAKQLVRNGSAKAAHCTTWVGLYEPRSDKPAQRWRPAEGLGQVLSAWPTAA